MRFLVWTRWDKLDAVNNWCFNKWSLCIKTILITFAAMVIH